MSEMRAWRTGDWHTIELMNRRCGRANVSVLLTGLLCSLMTLATPDRQAVAAEALPAAAILNGRVGSTPIPNSAFYPPTDSVAAPAFHGILQIHPSRLQTLPVLENPVQDGRDARLLPAVALEFFTLGDLLVPVQRGEMLRENASETPKPVGVAPASSDRLQTPSYWRLIAQVGRVWREKADGEWSRAAFPLMLVNDTENHAHQGLAVFLYKPDAARGGYAVSGLIMQFVQQTAPYLLRQHFVAWGSAQVTLAVPDSGALEGYRTSARAELAARLPAKPWSDLLRSVPAGTLDGFGGPVYPKWRVEAALVRDRTLYYQESATPYGPYPYPLEMRFGVRSVMKSVGAPLALLHLAQVYGPWVLTLKVGDYVAGIDPKWKRVRFIDAANMATGFGGTGSLKTNPNDINDGYLEGNYDAWYIAHSHVEKLAQINANLHPYPWEPGTVMRYRDQDFYLLGAALDGFLKSVRGPDADVWEMLKADVFGPIGVAQAPAVRTREAEHRDGLVWLNAGYYPTLDDLAKIALLYQDLGASAGHQILHRQLTADLLAAQDAMQKDGDLSVTRARPESTDTRTELYKMGLHFVPYVSMGSHKLFHLPTMSGSGENEVTLYPNHLISIVIAKAAQLPPGEQSRSNEGPQTARAVERLAPF